MVELHRKGSSPACLLADWLAILAVRSIVQPGNKESGLQRVASFAKILSPYLYTSGVAVVKSSAQAPGQLDSDPPTVEDLDYAAELLARVQYIYRSGLSLLIPSSWQTQAGLSKKCLSWAGLARLVTNLKSEPVSARAQNYLGYPS